MAAYHSFRPATAKDISYILTQEANRSNAYIHRWDEATHTCNIANTAFHYLIAQNPETKALGYAILKDDENHSVEWRRVVVASPGRGVGKAFMADVLNHFISNGKQRVWLDVYENNTRARRVYEHLGFTETHREVSPQDPANTLVFMEYRPQQPSKDCRS